MQPATPVRNQLSIAIICLLLFFPLVTTAEQNTKELKPREGYIAAFFAFAPENVPVDLKVGEVVDVVGSPLTMAAETQQDPKKLYSKVRVLGLSPTDWNGKKRILVSLETTTKEHRMANRFEGVGKIIKVDEAVN